MEKRCDPQAATTPGHLSVGGYDDWCDGRGDDRPWPERADAANKLTLTDQGRAVIEL
jgi:hypothetical protein